MIKQFRFRDLNQLSNEQCKKTTGLTKNHFEKILEECPSLKNTTERSRY